jgi:hypothetical protein
VTEDRAALDEARDAREAIARQRRDEKRRVSEVMIGRAAKVTESLKAADTGDGIAVSELRNRMERERDERDQERIRAMRQRNKDYNAFVREKDQRMTDVLDKPDYESNGIDAQREAEAKWRTINMRRLRGVQEQQAEERRQRELAEIEERRAESRDRDTMFFLPDNER